MKYGFLRSTSKIILAFGIVVAGLSFAVGFIALLTRSETNNGLLYACVSLLGIAAGICIAAGGQLLEVILDMRDDVRKLNECVSSLALKLQEGRDSVLRGSAA